MEVAIKGPIPIDPRQRVLAIEAVTKSICEQVGQDPADGVMMLLTAAAHLTMVHSDKSGEQLHMKLATCLGHAMDAATGFFELRPAATDGGEK